MVPLIYSDRIFTKTDLGAREWGVTLTAFWPNVDFGTLD